MFGVGQFGITGLVAWMQRRDEREGKGRMRVSEAVEMAEEAAGLGGFTGGSCKGLRV